MTNKQQPIKGIIAVTPGYTKGKCYSSPTYSTTVTLQLDDNTTIEHRLTCMKLSDLKRKAVIRPIQGAFVETMPDGNLYFMVGYPYDL